MNFDPSRRSPRAAWLVTLALAANFALAGLSRGAEEQELSRYPTVVRRAVTLWSDGTRLAADLHYPKGHTADENLPAIVLCHGWGGTKQHLNAQIAPQFAAAGFVVLSFDYRGWGESDSRLVMLGEMPKPDEEGNVTVKAQAVRQLVDPLDQQEDIDAAISFIEGEPGVDAERIGIWGSSFGGGHVIWRAAHDKRVACVVAQVGGMDASFGQDYDAVHAMEIKRARGEMEPVPQKEVEAVPGLTGMPYLDRFIDFDPVNHAKKIDVPVLIIDAENEHYFDIKLNGGKVYSQLKAKGVTAEYHIFPGVGHYDVYRGETLKKTMELEVPWFVKHLKAGK